MRKAYKLIFIALLVAGLAACGKHGGNTDDSQVLATVNGSPITQADLRAFVRMQAQGQEPVLTPVQRASLIKTLVKMETVAQAARKAGVDKDPITQAEMHLNNNDILVQTLLENYAKSHQPTEAELKSAYDAKVKAMDPNQYKARHILVKDQAQAQDIINQLNKGANFATLAKKYSQDPGSAKNGGELGDWFSGSTMVPEFAHALAGLKKGEYTKQPVQTQYGWHVIQLEDVRPNQAPSFEQMHEQLTSELQNKAIDDYIKQITGSAKVDIKDTGAAPEASTPAPAAGTAKR
ncbi:MAG TPA: peptidylprolyl isomerase [Gammaproteobacteria bacterium]|nr:peptidylprolyl isomerase [Gammaproteobacteria bacterium]